MEHRYILLCSHHIFMFLDPKPTCTIIKRAYGSISSSLESLLLECTFPYSGRVAPLLRWTEDALIDIGFESSSCWAYEQNVSCKIPFRFYQAVREDVLDNALQSGSMNTVATFSEGCNQYKCYWGKSNLSRHIGYNHADEEASNRFNNVSANNSKHNNYNIG